MSSIIKGTLMGVLITVVLYFVPGVGLLAPLFGGFIGAYIAAKGFGGGIKVGILMPSIMVLPSFLLFDYTMDAIQYTGIVGYLCEIFPPLEESINYYRWYVAVVLFAHIAILEFVGAVIGGWIGGSKDL